MVVVTAYTHYIFGIGNFYASDDRIGLYIIDELASKVDSSTCYTKKIDSDLFEIIPDLEMIPESRPILLIDAIITDTLPIGSVLVFDTTENTVSELKFGSSSHTLSIMDIIAMNKATSKKNLSTLFLGIVIENTEYGEEINNIILEKKDFILELIHKFCINIDIKGVYEA